MSGSTSIFRIREVESRDHLELVKLWRSVWTHTYGPSLGSGALQKMLRWLDENSVRGMLPNQGERAFCAESSGELTGSIVIVERGKIAYCWGMYVDPRFQRQHIGSALLSTAISTVSEAQAVEVRVLMTSPWATAFYLSQGFSQTSTELTTLVPNVTVERVIMSKLLKQDQY